MDPVHGATGVSKEKKATSGRQSDAKAPRRAKTPRSTVSSADPHVPSVPLAAVSSRSLSATTPAAVDTPRTSAHVETVRSEVVARPASSSATRAESLQDAPSDISSEVSSHSSDYEFLSDASQDDAWHVDTNVLTAPSSAFDDVAAPTLGLKRFAAMVASIERRAVALQDKSVARKKAAQRSKSVPVS